MNGYSPNMPTPVTIAAMVAAYNESEDWLDALNAYMDEGLVWAAAYIEKEASESKGLCSTSDLCAMGGFFQVWLFSEHVTVPGEPQSQCSCPGGSLPRSGRGRAFTYGSALLVPKPRLKKPLIVSRQLLQSTRRSRTVSKDG